MGPQEKIFTTALKEFAEKGEANDICAQTIYAAIACGGGEVALYTLLAGIYRRHLRDHNQSLRLSINQHSVVDLSLICSMADIT